MYGFLFVFILFLNCLNSNVLAFLPVDLITKASLNFITFDFELLGEGGVSKPFIFRESESDFETVFAFFSGGDFRQVLEKGLVDLSDLFADDIARDEGLEPVLVEEFLFVVVVFQAVFFFGEDGVGLEVAVSVIVGTGDDVVDLLN